MPIKTTYHRDRTVTIWDVYTQGWVRTDRPRDEVLASLDSKERERVIRHCRISQKMTLVGLVLELAGERYIDVQSKLQQADFDGCYPVVNSRGVLTGSVADAQTALELCDFDDEGNVVISRDACSAMVLPQELHTAPCKACGEPARYNHRGYECCGHIGCRAEIEA